MASVLNSKMTGLQARQSSPIGPRINNTMMRNRSLYVDSITLKNDLNRISIPVCPRRIKHLPTKELAIQTNQLYWQHCQDFSDHLDHIVFFNTVLTGDCFCGKKTSTVFNFLEQKVFTNVFNVSRQLLYVNVLKNVEYITEPVELFRCRFEQQA